MNKEKLTMYDVAKQLVANEVPMDAVLYNKKITATSKDMVKKYAWMLLCRERNDYTVFLTDDCLYSVVSRELMETLNNRGQVLLIDKQPDGAYEIWIRDVETNDNFVYYLFDYTEGIIDCV